MVITRILEKLFKLEPEYFPCESCATLKQQLDIANEEKLRLINQLIELTKPVQEIKQEMDLSAIKPIAPVGVPWHIKQRQLEIDSARRSKELREKEIEKNRVAGQPQVKIETVEQLEKELNLETEIPISPVSATGTE